MTEPILQFFEFTHLPVYLQPVSRPFHELAHLIVGAVPRNPERTVALRKLLESKDACVRAAIYAEPIKPHPTVAELEAILNSEDKSPVEILPDGTVRAKE
jgi:hypothetical protein